MSRFIAWSSVAAVVLVAAIAGWVSYLHAWEVVRAHGEPGMVGRLYPRALARRCWPGDADHGQVRRGPQQLVLEKVVRRVYVGNADTGSGSDDQARPVTPLEHYAELTAEAWEAFGEDHSYGVEIAQAAVKLPGNPLPGYTVIPRSSP